MMRLLVLLPLLTAHASYGQNRSSAPPAASDEVINLLQALADAPGPSGFEDPVRKIMVERMKPLSDKISYDGLGSVIAVQGSSGPRIMVAAHMDELGGVVRRVTADGYLTMQMLGGWLDQALVDQRWTIIGSKGPVRAVTGIRDVHILPDAEGNKVFPRDSLFLDIGAKSNAEVAAMGLEPGNPVAPDAPFSVMNGTQNYLGKARDDRVGCAVVIEAMRRMAHVTHANQIFWVATVQEEVLMRGSRTSSDLVKPEIGLSLEGGVTRDAPGVGAEEAQEVLGGGPAIFLYDYSTLPNRKLVARFGHFTRLRDMRVLHLTVRPCRTQAYAAIAGPAHVPCTELGLASIARRLLGIRRNRRPDRQKDSRNIEYPRPQASGFRATTQGAASEAIVGSSHDSPRSGLD